MAIQRINIQLGIPENVYNAISVVKKLAFRDMIREWKVKAVKINEGQMNEEATVKATMHLCYHDQPELNKPCEPEVEI